MLSGIPSIGGICPQTDRLKIVKFIAETAADELFLTKLHQALKNAGEVKITQQDGSVYKYSIPSVQE